MSIIEKLIDKFQLKSVDEDRGIAKDLICTDCGQRRMFKIAGVCIGVIDGEGYMHSATDFEFHDQSMCWCMDCGKEGIISDFQIKGLDAVLKAKK